MCRPNQRAKLEKVSIASCVRRGMDGLMSSRRMRAVMIISIRRLVGFYFLGGFIFFFSFELCCVVYRERGGIPCFGV